MEFENGIIVSIQGYSLNTTQELANNAINAGAVGIRTDKLLNIDIPYIVLKKTKVEKEERIKIPFITPTIEDIQFYENKIDKDKVYIAVDYRVINKNLKSVSDYCRQKKIKIVADIANIGDYKNILSNNYYHDYIATTLSVLYYDNKYFPDIWLAQELYNSGCKNIIAEGNFSKREDVRKVFYYGINNICIGSAISDIYKLTQKYTSIIKE